MTTKVKRPASKKGIGASLSRQEDDRYLNGRGKLVGDIKMQGMLELAFVRSPIAHGNIIGVTAPETPKDRVFTAKSLCDVKSIKADSGLPGFRSSLQPILADEKVRHERERVLRSRALLGDGGGGEVFLEGLVRVIRSTKLRLAELLVH